MALGVNSDYFEWSLLEMGNRSTHSGHWLAPALNGSVANDAVDGAHSAASECQRVVAL